MDGFSALVQPVFEVGGKEGIKKGRKQLHFHPFFLFFFLFLSLSFVLCVCLHWIEGGRTVGSVVATEVAVVGGGQNTTRGNESAQQRYPTFSPPPPLLPVRIFLSCSTQNRSIAVALEEEEERNKESHRDRNIESMFL